MAEIPAGEYTQHIHRSIDQLRSMNERGVLGTITGTLVHDYKQFSDRIIDNRLDGGGITIINGINTDITDLRQHQQQQHQQQTQPSNPSTPISMHEAQMNNDSKIFNSKGDLQLHTGGGGGGGGGGGNGGVGGGGGGGGGTHSRRNHAHNGDGENKPYKCTQCTKTFANSSYLSQHTRIHLGIKPYRCEICQRKFTQLSHLQQHIRTHTGDKPYKCRHVGCQKAFSQLSNLQSHSRCHQTDKPYKCNSCYKCFQDETALLDHIPKHKESKHLKTHICQYCGKSYTQETYLAKHVQKHQERPEKINNRAATSATTLAGLGLNLNRNLGLTNATLVATTDHHPYWPKVSPDSAAATLAEAMQQQQQTIQYDFTALGQHPVVTQHATPEQIQQHHRALLNHHRVLNGVIDTGGGGNTNNNNNNNNNDNNTDGEDLVVVRQQQTSNNIQQQQHIANNNSNNNNNPSSTSSTPSGSNNSNSNNNSNNSSSNSNNNNNNNNSTATVVGYDAASITKTTNSSAFTPIQAMTMAPHLNTLTHHQFQRPYIYDAITFQNNKNIVNQNAVANSFPNQLISLHQIRNYQPTGPGGLMSGEHLLGIGVGAGGKEKAQ